MAAQKQQSPLFWCPFCGCRGVAQTLQSSCSYASESSGTEVLGCNSMEELKPTQKKRKGFPAKLKEIEEIHKEKDKTEQQFVQCEKNQCECHGLGTLYPNSKN